MKQQKQIEYPSIIFRLQGQLFCADSQYVTTILQLPEFEPVPDAPSYITGIFPYRGDIIQMLDLRAFWGMESLCGEYETFASMLDLRKQDHLHWVSELERCIKMDEPFTLATDPHKCAFGQWYDSFESENNEINFQLRKIDKPHQLLHASALEVAQCTQQCDLCQREICLKEVLERAKGQYMPEILTLLDETKDTFKSAVYHEMALVLGEFKLALIVDEVLAVEALGELGALPQTRSSQESFISGVATSTKLPGAILALNMPALLDAVRPGECRGA